MSVWRDSARDSALFHPQTVLRQLNAFRHHNLYCDVTISAAGTRFRCHRAVLAANSVFFHHLLLPSDRAGGRLCGDGCYHLEWMGAGTFSALLQYMYTSQLFLPDEHTARELLHGARRVGLLALVDLVADYLLDSDGSDDRTEPSAGEEGGDGNDAGEGGVPADNRPAEKDTPTFKLELLEPADPGHNLEIVDMLPQEPADPGYNSGSVDSRPQEPANPGCKLDIVPREPASEVAGGAEETDGAMDQVMTSLRNLSELFSTNGRHQLEMVTANSSGHIRHDSSLDQSASCSPAGVGQDDQRSGNSDDPKEQRSGNSDDPKEQRSGNSDDSKEQRSGNSNDQEEQRSENSDDPEGQRSENSEDGVGKRGWMEEECSLCNEVWSTRKRLRRNDFCHRANKRKENMKKSLPLKGPEQCPDCRQTFHHRKDWTRHPHRHRKYQVCPEGGKFINLMGLRRVRHRDRTQFVCETCRKPSICKGHWDRHICRHLVQGGRVQGGRVQGGRVPLKCTKCEKNVCLKCGVKESPRSSGENR
ncbi:zinc finger and BTB domain-containing protein 17-like [Branchiostoma lanceolatum]|uniref:zinc finger and BTB domain-containing protein 17-like n=1 Tax=Branchiostoma lanceolatum TaxID=7740 RepID=UPI0034521896